jgi:hypothetical protein
MSKLSKHRTGGPKTAAGLAVTSRNALKSGAYSLNQLIEGEDPDEFETLCNDLIQDEKPQNTVQHILISKLAQTQWRMRRLDQYELTIYQRLKTEPIKTHEWVNHLGFNFQEVINKSRTLRDSDLEHGVHMYLKGLAWLEAVYREFPTTPPKLEVLTRSHECAYALLRGALSISEDTLAKALADDNPDGTRKSFWLGAKAQAEAWIQSRIGAFDAHEQVVLAIGAIHDARICDYLLEARHTRPMQDLYRTFTKILGELRKEQAICRAQKAVLIDPVQSHDLVREKSEELIAEVT